MTDAKTKQNRVDSNFMNEVKKMLIIYRLCVKSLGICSVFIHVSVVAHLVCQLLMALSG